MKHSSIINTDVLSDMTREVPDRERLCGAQEELEEAQKALTDMLAVARIRYVKVLEEKLAVSFDSDETQVIKALYPKNYCTVEDAFPQLPGERERTIKMKRHNILSRLGEKLRDRAMFVVGGGLEPSMDGNNGLYVTWAEADA